MSRDRHAYRGREGEALAAFGLLLGFGLTAFEHDPAVRRLKQRHFWVYWVLSMTICLALLGLCVFAFIELLGYWQHTTPCQRMGTC